MVRLGGKVDAVKLIPESVAVDAAPGVTGVTRAAREQLADVVHPVAREPRLHLRADARDLTQCQRVERVRQVARLEHDEAVWLLEIGGELGQEAVGRDPDRAGQPLADMRTDAGLDAVGQRRGGIAAVLVVEQPAGHLVDRADLRHRNVPPYLGDDRLVELDIAFMARRRDDQLAALLLRLPYRRPRPDAEPLRLDRGGDRDRGIGVDRRDDHRLAA
jgi:hypothetical protein